MRTVCLLFTFTLRAKFLPLVWAHQRVPYDCLMRGCWERCSPSAGTTSHFRVPPVPSRCCIRTCANWIVSFMFILSCGRRRSMAGANNREPNGGVRPRGFSVQPQGNGQGFPGLDARGHQCGWADAPWATTRKTGGSIASPSAAVSKHWTNWGTIFKGGRRGEGYRRLPGRPGSVRSSGAPAAGRRW